MASAESLMSGIKVLDKNINSLAQQRKQLLQEWAAAVCPFMVGEKTICKGYAHEGKACVIERIKATTGYGGKYQWEVVVRILNKDGEPSKKDTSFTQSQYERTH